MVEGFAGKTAFVTGAASGIGRATALAFAREGARLILLDIKREGMEHTLAEAGGDGIALHIDLADPDAAGEAARAAIERTGGVACLTNIAGVSDQPDQLADVAAPLWLHRLSINLVAPAVLTRVVAEDMIRRGTAGRIVNVSSSAAFRPTPSFCYASAKAGIVGLTRASAAELAAHGINVNAVAPGVTRTPMVSDPEGMARSGPSSNLFGRPAEAEDVAATILYLCRPESRQLTGQVIHTSAGTIV